MPDRPKIRIGFIGLSSKPDSWATLAHLPYLRRSAHYEIVALCNSTPEKAAQSIAAHHLPPTTKAYASSAELAADDTIDLIVICTRVDTHHAVALPTLLTTTTATSSTTKAKPRARAIFIEWPLAATTRQGAELVSLARANNIRTIIGLQARVSPTLLKIQEIVASGRLGAIHSVNVHATSGVWQHDIASARYEHFLQREVGGNLLTIYGIHILDAVFAAVGELVPGSYSVVMGNLRPRMTVAVAAKGEGSTSTSTSHSHSHSHSHAKTEHEHEHEHEHEQVEVEKDTPDQIMLIGRLTRPQGQAAAMLTFHLRAGSRAQNTPGALWRIYGDKAELVVEFASAGPQIGQATKIQLHRFAAAGGANKVAEEVEDVLIDEGGEEWTSLPVSGQNIGRLYEAFAVGQEGEADQEVPGWDVALKRHELIDDLWEKGGM